MKTGFFFGLISGSWDSRMFPEGSTKMKGRWLLDMIRLKYSKSVGDEISGLNTCSYTYDQTMAYWRSSVSILAKMLRARTAMSDWRKVVIAQFRTRSLSSLSIRFTIIWEKTKVKAKMTVEVDINKKFKLLLRSLMTRLFLLGISIRRCRRTTFLPECKDTAFAGIREICRPAGTR